MTDMTPSSATATAATIQEAAGRLIAAAASGEACAPVRDLIGSNDLDAAYAVQQAVTAERLARGARVVGRKIGLTSLAVQKQLGVDQPDFGFLFDDMAHPAGETVPIHAVLQPKVEAEVAFVLGKDLAEGSLDYAQVSDAIAYATPALEICGSRIASWDITFGDTVADNASGGGYVLGEVRKTLAEFEPASAEMSMSIDNDVVSTGNGAACLGDPVNAVVWLAQQARALGQPLEAGQVILSGALGPMSPVHPGSAVSATITGLGTVSVYFSAN